MPAGCGRKGSQAPRKRKQSQQVTERVDRTSSTQNYTQSSTSQAISGSNNHTLNIHLDLPTRQFQGGVMPSCSYYLPNPSFMTPGPSCTSPGASWMPSYHDWYADFSPLPPPPPPPMVQETAPSHQKLKMGAVWEQDNPFSSWFFPRTLQKWAQAFRDNEYHCVEDTKNGVEAQSKLLKYSYLPNRKNITLSSLVSHIIKSFLPDRYQKYLLQNYWSILFIQWHPRLSCKLPA